jgi:FSR family fosmidomycin resistance protein-like MFS transporter
LTSEPSRRGRVLAALTAAHTVNDFYGLVLPPLLPTLIAAFGLSYGQAGVIPFVSTGLSAVLQPTLGYLADRRRARRLFLVVGFAGYALAMLSLGSAGSYLTLLIAAAFLGLAGSTYHPQSATYLLFYFRDNRGFAQGIHGLGNGLGFFAAPIAVTVLAEMLGWEWAVRLLALPALLAIVLVLRALPEPSIQGGRGLLAGITRPLVLLTVVTGLALGVQTGFVTWLPSYYGLQGYSLVASGLLTASMSLAGLLAQPSGGTLSDRFGRRTVVLLSLLGVGVFQLLFLSSQALPLMVLFSLLAGFCGSLLPPVTMVYASELAAGQRSGLAVGVVWGLGTLVGAFAPLISGQAIDYFGFAPTYAGLALVSFVAAGLALSLPGRRVAAPTG